MSQTIDVVNSKGEKTDKLSLNEEIFSVKPLAHVVQEVVVAYQANQRRGTHATKTRGDVSGGGSKPWKQKGTGNARSGSNRSPLWRHGGTMFGPQPKSYVKPVPVAKRHLALRAVLSDYLREGLLQIVDVLRISEPKTKHVAAIVDALSLPERTLVVVDKRDFHLERAARNIENIRLCLADDLNAYDVMLSRRVVMTRLAVEKIEKRLIKSSETKAKEN